MLLKYRIFYFILIKVMDLLISTSSLGHSRHIEDGLFVRSTKNKFQLHITLFTK